MSTEIVPEFQPERYRPYLIGLARVELAKGGRVRKKLDASDLVQDVLLKACVAQDQFRGRTAEEYAAWLRRILANQLADKVRRFLRKKRAVGLEETYRETIEESAGRLHDLPVSRVTSPTQGLARQERALLIAEALDALPEDQRVAVELRYIAQWSLAEIAAHTDRSKPSVAGLLRRGLKALRQRLELLE
ncbi:MAG: sigma-70 family RNA polymerase sigma factor [Acidobacteriota bacterium]